MGFILSIIAVVGIYYIIKYNLTKILENRIQDGKYEMEDYVDSLHNFNKTKITFGIDITGEVTRGIAIDENQQKVCLVKSQNGVNRHKIIGYEDVYACEIIENGTAIQKTKIGSQLAGAAIGGILAGDTGAMIGGLSGKQEQIDMIKELGLRITINDTNEPNFHIYKIQSINPIQRGSGLYLANYATTEEWYGILRVIIKRNDKLPNSQLAENPIEQIRKLSDLKDSGVLTEEEYKYKKKLLLDKIG